MERLTERAEIDKCHGVWVKEGFAHDGKRTWFNGYDEGYSAISKCAKYEELEEQGKMLILPCEIGHRVYEIYRFLDAGAWEIEVHKIRLEDLDKIGKTVFLTREEAEAALKELCTSNRP